MNQLAKVDLLLVNLRVNGPVLGLEANLGSAVMENARRKGLWDYENGRDSQSKGQYGKNPWNPAPAKITFDNERANDRSECRANKCCARKDSDAIAALYGTVEISDSAANNCEGRRGEEASEKPADEDGLQVLGDSDRNVEDAKDGVANVQRPFAAVDFRERAEDDRTPCEALCCDERFRKRTGTRRDIRSQRARYRAE